MKLIGYWITALDDNDYLPPQEFVGDYDSHTRRAIADYLDSAQVFAVYRGYSWCRFNCSIQASIGHRELTDGQWVWPDGLSHYVRDHGVKLPDEFVARACCGAPEDVVGFQDQMMRPVDHLFWKQWCAANRSGEYATRIAAARRRADEQAAQAREQHIAAEVARLGVADFCCQTHGCDHCALNGIVFCAACTLKKSVRWGCREYYDIGPLLRL